MTSGYDLAVIGGGSAGIVAARFARQLGLSVVLVEKSRTGGDCTWTGCIPSKSLLKAASVAHQARNAGRYGLPRLSPQIDLAPVMARIRSVIYGIYQTESPEALRAEGIEVLSGPARFLDRRVLRVGGLELKARRFLICTGASPIIPPVPGIDSVGYLTYETVWDLDVLPEKLTVVGGGPVGCELAQAFNRLGSRVTLVEAAGRLLPQDEPEASALLAGRFTVEGIDLRLGLSLKSAAKLPSGVRLVLSNRGIIEVGRETGQAIGWQNSPELGPEFGPEFGLEITPEIGRQNSPETVLDAGLLLLAVGRRPNLEDLGLEAAGVAHDGAGIKVDRYLRTSQRHVYAAGDCTGSYQFTHYAAYQGFMAVSNAFLPVKQRAVLPHVPWATFTDPEVAHVGLTEAQARQQRPGGTVAIRFPMSRVDRALTDGEPEGFVKVVHRPNGRLLGATIAAPNAGELIHEYALALNRRLKLSHLARLVHVYPTYSTASQQLAAEATVNRLLSGRFGGLVRWLARRGR